MAARSKGASMIHGLIIIAVSLSAGIYIGSRYGINSSRINTLEAAVAKIIVEAKAKL